MREDDQLPGELAPVVTRLQAERLDTDPVELDQLKRRVINRVNGQRLTGGSMKSRLATILTLVALVGGSGGALAVAGGSSGGASPSASAAKSQYSPTKKTCKKGTKKVRGKCVKNKSLIIKRKKPSPKHLTGPAFTASHHKR